MRHMPALAALVGGIMLAAAAPVIARDWNQVPEATPVGKPQLCIPRSRIRNTKVRTNSVIDFMMLGGKVYRSTLQTGCPGLDLRQGFGYATSIDQLCASDIITVINQSPGPIGATCGLGKFQEITLPLRDKRP